MLLNLNDRKMSKAKRNIKFKLMRIFLLIIVLALCNACTKQEDIVSPKPTEATDIRIGDNSVNYVNPEISPDGSYMIWLEVDMTNGVSGRVWHCGIDPNTGDLIPSDGKGFSPFTSNIYARPADWGWDNQGVYYVGATNAGQIKMVRPTSPTSGTVTDINVPINNRRRVFYPSQLPNSSQKFLIYIENDVVNGFSSSTPGNTKFQLRLLDLNNPANDYLIEEQPANYPQTAPMDVIVPRWMKGTSYLTYGYKDTNGKVQAKEFNAFTPTLPPIPVTNDVSNKVDGYPVLNPLTNNQYFMSGIDGSNTAYFYRRNAFGTFFVQSQTITPVSVHLSNPALNQSHEPFILNNQLYSTFQINNNGGNFFETTFNQPGEIWLTTIDAGQNKMWLLSKFDSSLNVSEPEPYVGNGKAWVFYSAVRIDRTVPYLKRQFQLRRCNVNPN